MTKLLCASTSSKWLDLYCEILADAEHDVLRTGADEAVLQLGPGTFDLIVTDLRFGHTEAFALIVAARQHAIPVLVISPDIAHLFHEPYADLYVEPPVAPHELLAIVDDLLKSRARPNAAKTEAAVAA